MENDPRKLAEHEWDLVILGGGLAGAAAACFARERGLDFCVVCDGMGGTEHFSGAFDLLDPRLRDAGFRPESFAGWAEELAIFSKAHPGHLYSELVQRHPTLPEELPGAMRRVIAFYGIVPVEGGNSPLAVFGPSGREKICPFAMPGQGLSLSRPAARGRALYVHFPHLGDYPVEAIRTSLSKRFEGVDVVTPEKWPVNSLTPAASLIAAFDRPGVVQELVDRLRGRVTGTVLLPPVLGVERHGENRRLLEGSLGVSVIELLSTLPSAAGLRFARAARNTVREKALPWFKARVRGFEADGRRILAVTAVADGVTFRVRGHRYLLATGKFVGGGIIHRGGFAEGVFGLPLFESGRMLSPREPVSRSVAPRASDPQPFLGVGVATDRLSRPMGLGGAIYDNLIACGHVLAGFDYTREHCGAGMSIASAWSAFAGR